ncbi:dynactin subunit 6 [Ditylenchus destructor]|uniref:Dynactin subunit 6 n=1 Tax=Ditylenchus destructor TaxID=166010 RepID=A0AAD4N5U1_9BILA|nr:dynactin subunit 6 [Ditylenchus destructor]
MSTPTLNIAPDAIVVADATLRGKITIGPSTIVHPKAVIDAKEGEIILGSHNIVEETAVIENLNGTDYVMRIGDDNLFEVGSICHAKSVGNSNVFGIKSIVGSETEITEGCKIGPACKVLNEKLEPLTAVYFERNLRRTTTETPASQRSQCDFLRKLMPKYNMALQNTKK